MAMNAFGGWMSAIVRDDHEALREEILIGLDFSAKDAFGQSPIHWAAESGAERCLALLLASGDDPMRMTSGGDFPLIIAAGRRRLGCVKALASFGADVFGARGLTALMIATKLGEVEAVKVLSSDSSIEKRDRDGMSALHMAAEADNKACLLALLSAGASPAARDRLGNTPLMTACSSMQTEAACVEILACLESQGAVNEEGLSAFDLADQNGACRALAALLRHAQSPELTTSWFWRFAATERRDMAEASMDGLVLNSRNSLQQTPLMVAAKLKWRAIVESIADASDKAAIDHRGNNALMLLVSNRGWPEKELLEILNYPWATSQRNKEGHMAEEQALDCGYAEAAQVLAALREHDELAAASGCPASHSGKAGMRL